MKKMKKLALICLVLIGVALGSLIACGSGVEISFETNGAPKIESVVLEKGELYELPVPVWEGYEFEGWYSDKSFSGEPVLSLTAEEKCTFYAKWTALSPVTLDLDGGSLAEGTKLYLKSGENLYDFMSRYVPVKTDCEFGAWFLGDTELSASAVMPAEGVSLKARYKIAYTVQVYKQTLAQNDYIYTAADDIRGYEYAGTQVTPAPEVHGFTVVPNENSVASKTLSENASENVFRLYYDRVEYTVEFACVFPVSLNESATYLYGTEIEIPFDLFHVEGYLFLGWADSVVGDLIYPHDPAAEAFNGGTHSEETPKLLVEDDITLYADFIQSYTDLFGSKDNIFLPDENGDVIYLSRAGILFVGEYDAQRREFRFLDENGDLLLLGKIYDGFQYAFYSDSRGSYSCTLYVMGRGLDNSTKIYFDAYNGITYSVSGSTGAGTQTDDSQGTYEIDEDGQLIATFTTGSLAGQTLILRRVTVTINNSSVSAFQVRDEEAYGWGALYRAEANASGLVYYTAAYTLTLDGFGTALFNNGAGITTYYYSRVEDDITVFGLSGEVAGTFRYSNINGRHCYAAYNSRNEHVYTSAEGETLTLDGCYSATYQNATGTQNGYFYTTSSVFGTLVYFVTVGATVEQQLFLAQETAHSVESEEGTVTEYTYSFTKKPIGYAEYYYSDATNVYYAPLIVFNDDMATEGKITIYGYVLETGTYEKALLGDYELAEGRFAFTTTSRYEYSPEVYLEPYDYSRIAAIVFGVDAFTSATINGTYVYPVSYWHSVTYTDSESTQFDRRFKETEGEGTLTFVGAFCIYTAGETTVVGQYTLNENLLTVTPYGLGSSYYFEIDEENSSFVLLTGLLGSAYGYDVQTGYGLAEETLTFNGKGGVTYSFVTEEGDEQTVEGVYRDTGEYSLGGWSVYAFTETDGDLRFEFILFTASNTSYFSVCSERVTGEYTRTVGQYGETLVLDGYGLYASYTDGSGYVYQGVYTMPEEGVVLLVYDANNSICFDLSGRTFTVRGGEYGTYLLIENNGWTGDCFTFDGYGAMSVFTFDEEGNQMPIDPEGSYERTQTGFILRYRRGNTVIELTGERGTVTFSGVLTRAFFIDHIEYVYTYVDATDWSVLVLGASGRASKYLQDGSREAGWYYLITDDLLYYTDESGANHYLYRYSRESGVIEKISYLSRGYFTEDLDALLFDESGFMISGGNTRYYYEILANGNVRLYRQDASDPSANRYGFVVDDSFGQFSDVASFGGKTYYVNGGFAIRFVRQTGNEEKYPMQLTLADGTNVPATIAQLSFAPTGSAEFTVVGTIVLDYEVAGAPLRYSSSCYVTRTVGEDGEIALYVTIGSIRLDIDVSYLGDGSGSANTFAVNAMKAESGYYASTYFLNYYQYYMLYGQAIANSFGYITFCTEYDENGEAAANYINAEFGLSSGVTDAQGTPIRLSGVEYTTWGSNIYSVDFTGEDGLQYRLRIRLTSAYYRRFGLYSYDLLSFSLVDSLESGDYGVEVERVIASDVYGQGAVYTVALTLSGEAIAATRIYFYNNVAYYIVEERESEDGDVPAEELTVTYYLIRLSVSEEIGVGRLPEYSSVTVEKISAQRYFGSDENNFVDISENNEVLLFAMDGLVYFVSGSTYDEQTQTYTIEVYAGGRFVVSVADGVMTIVEQS